MPARKELQDKFMTDSDDGLQKAEDVIVSAGGHVSNQFKITKPDFKNLDEEKRQEISEAIEFLIDEHGFELRYEPKPIPDARQQTNDPVKDKKKSNG